MLLTFVPSHLDLATMQAGAVAEEAEQKMKEKYAELTPTHHFVPVTVKTTVVEPEAHDFFCGLSRCIKVKSGEPLSHQYLLQRISVAIQWENAAAVLGTSPPSVCNSIYFQ